MHNEQVVNLVECGGEVEHGGNREVANRAVSVTHVPIHELFMAYARSHFYPAAELLLVLIVATNFDAPSDMYNVTWMLWAIGAALLAVPFLYNPNTLHLLSLIHI